MGTGHETNNGVTNLEILGDQLPPGDVHVIAVRPCSSLGTKGKAIAAKIKQ